MSTCGSADARVVEEQVDSAVRCDDRVEELANARLVGDVGRDRLEGPAEVGAASDDVSSSAALPPTREDDGPAVLGERERDRRSDPATAAGHDGNALGDIDLLLDVRVEGRHSLPHSPGGIRKPAGTGR